MSDLIPVGWSVRKIGDAILSAQGGVSVNSENRPKVGKEFGILKTSSVVDGRFFPIEHKAILGNEVERASIKPQKNHILFSRMNTPVLVGQSGYVDRDHDELFLPDRLWQIKVANQFNAKWLSYTLRSQNVVKCITDAATGTSNTMKNIAKPNLLAIPMLCPSLPEQQKIAAILTSVDEVIEKTQAQCDKLKDLKTAMMQTLLTKGVGIDGKPHTEFKDSPVGRIPKGWEVSSLGELASFVTSGSRGWAQYYSKSGAIFIRIGNLTREHINFRFKDIIYVTPPNSAEGKRTLVQTGDVLISITADLGVIAVVNDDIKEAYVNQHVSLVRLEDKRLSRWIGHFLSFEKSQKQFTASNDSGAKAGLNLSAIRNTSVVLPPRNEMNQIVKNLDALDDSISIKRGKLLKLADTKKALMQDLLTGKVRVTVPKPSSAKAS